MLTDYSAIDFKQEEYKGNADCVILNLTRALCNNPITVSLLAGALFDLGLQISSSFNWTMCN